MVFAREVGGEELTFGVSGKLIMNAVVMYDHQTETLWSQFLASAVDGPLSGVDLELVPSQLTTWAAWTKQHPDTKLLDRSIGRRGGRDPYFSYYNSGNAGVLGEANRDKRLRTKELIIGLDHGRERIAYGFTNLRSEPIINDFYDGDPTLITYDALGQAAVAFDRTVGGAPLTFEAVDESTMTDRETGSVWSTISGEALSGDHAGEQLTKLPSFVAFWFSWSDFYPGTDVYEANDQLPS